MGGRDWDLVAFPAFFLMLWGVLHLLKTARTEDSLRQIRIAILPIMIVHMGLFIGVNASAQRSVERLGNLLLHTPNQPRHYQAFTRGHYYLNIRQDQYEKAVFHLRQALASAPPTNIERRQQYARYLANALLNIGVRQQEQGDLTAAIAAYEEAIQLKPNFAKAHYDLGVVYNRLGNHRQAISAYRNRLHLLAGKSEDADTLYNLGMSHLLLGERDVARRQYERLQKVDPGLAAQLLRHF
jgi:tetratricopeptide (TPR) repeat protein